MLAAERDKDRSVEGQRAALRADVARPFAATKKTWFATITSTTPQLSMTDLRAAMGSLFFPHQDELRSDFAEQFFTQLERARTRDNEFLSRFTAALAPALCTDQSAKKLRSFLDDHPSLPAVVIKELRMVQEEDARCARIRAASATGP